MAQTITLTINGQNLNYSVPDTTIPLLWVLRDITPIGGTTNLTGTKYGCGVTLCGACTVLADGAAVKTCTENVGNFIGKKIVTIEGLATSGIKFPLVGKTAADLVNSWVKFQVPQCGYCQSGMMLAATALLAKATVRPTDADINKAMTNLCACGTYPRVMAAIRDICP